MQTRSKSNRIFLELNSLYRIRTHKPEEAHEDAPEISTPELPDTSVTISNKARNLRKKTIGSIVLDDRSETSLATLSTEQTRKATNRSAAMH